MKSKILDNYKPEITSQSRYMTTACNGDFKIQNVLKPHFYLANVT